MRRHEHLLVVFVAQGFERVLENVVVECQAVVVYRRCRLQGDVKSMAMQILPLGRAQQGEMGCGEVQGFFADLDSGLHDLSLSLSSL